MVVRVVMEELPLALLLVLQAQALEVLEMLLEQVVAVVGREAQVSAALVLYLPAVF